MQLHIIMFIYKGCALCVFVFFFFISFVCLLGKCVLEMICVRHDVNIVARFVKNDFDPSQGYANKFIVRDTFCMRTSRSRRGVFVRKQY